MAIKGEVTHIWRNKHKTNKWNHYAKNSSLLNNIKKCIERINDPKALYYGTAALYYVVNHTPPGIVYDFDRELHYYRLINK